MAPKSSSPHVGTRKADSDPLLPSDFKFYGRPVAGWPRTIDATAPDPFACLKISMLVESVDEPTGVGQNLRFPFRAAPDPSKEHG